MMRFAELRRAAVSDILRHVGQQVVVSICGADSRTICAQYWRQNVDVFDRDAGLPISSSVHWMMVQRSDFVGLPYPRAGDEVIIDDMKFRIASAPQSDGVGVKFRLHVADADAFHEPTFDAY